jgi:hypothetical protein
MRDFLERHAPETSRRMSYGEWPGGNSKHDTSGSAASDILPGLAKRRTIYGIVPPIRDAALERLCDRWFDYGPVWKNSCVKRLARSSWLELFSSCLRRALILS